MNNAPSALPSLDEWEEKLAVSDANELERCMGWVHRELRDLSDSPLPGWTTPEEWSYWTSLFLMVKREYGRRGKE